VPPPCVVRPHAVAIGELGCSRQEWVKHYATYHYASRTMLRKHVSGLPIIQPTRSKKTLPIAQTISKGHRKSGRACAHRAAIARANACTRPDSYHMLSVAESANWCSTQPLFFRLSRHDTTSMIVGITGFRRVISLSGIPA
jgi:hypothetical protein